MQSVCNLGVWCISIQQFNKQILASHFHSLLQAVVHALDNPIGSLSTTFEATQVQELAQSFFILSQHIWNGYALLHVVSSVMILHFSTLFQVSSIVFFIELLRAYIL